MSGSAKGTSGISTSGRLRRTDPVSRTTRYYAVATVLREEIRSGLFPVGEMFLTEMEICTRFAVSRFTAREALRRLEEAGLIERRQGSGTRVVARDVERRYVLSLGSDADVLRYATDTVLIARGTWKRAAKTQRDFLHLDRDRSWIVLDATRRTKVGGPAIGLTSVYVDAGLEEHTAGLEVAGPQPIFAQLANAYGAHILSVEHEIFATTLSATAARRLGVPEGSPGLRVIRRFTASELGLFEVTDSIHPGDRFLYSLTLTNASA